VKRFFFLLATVVALGVAAPAMAAPFKGTVVAKQRGTLLVAAPSGVVRAISGSARVGARVAVSGTRVRTIGVAHRAVVRGVVVRRSAGVTFLSVAKHMLVLHTARRLASVSDTTPSTTTPQAGALVQTNVAINPQGDLEEQDEQQVGQTGAAQVTATISAIGNGTVTLTVAGQPPLTIPLPAGLTLPQTMLNKQVTLNVSFAGGEATAEPDGQNGDDDGDNNDDNGANGDQSSGGGND
jgi:hypothetical protein